MKTHAYDHGTIHFHTYTGRPEQLEGVISPYTAGGELIIWWNDIEYEEGVYDWSAVDAELDAFGARDKKLDIRLSTVHNDPNNSPPWLYEKYNVRRVGRGHFTDFEKKGDGYRIETAGSYVTDPNTVITGKRSVKNDGPGVFLSFGDSIPLDHDGRYSVQFDYRVLAGGEFEVRAVTEDGGNAHTLRQRYTLETGAHGSETFVPELSNYHDYRIEWEAHGEAVIVVDAVLILKLVSDLAWEQHDFSTGLGPWALQAGAQRTHTEQGWAVVGENNTDRFVPLLTNNPDVLRFTQDRGYAVMVEATALTDCIIRYELVSRNDGTVLDEHEFTVKAGERIARNCHYGHLLWRPECVVKLGLVGSGKVAFNQLSHLIWSDRVPCFPDYFSPAFAKKWEDFVTAFAERYRDHPTLGIVSVGGFGRWEEVMLDDDVAHGLLDRQWLARGFTQEQYLAHVEWCMDLYQELMPDTPLRICLAYGLQDVNDVDWIYRRTAQAAAKRGIGLKQNGLSELYDTWNDNTNGSYLFDRYRYVENVSLTHETGGQIYRNLLDAHGHPVSLLNRAMVNAIDFLFLYGPDVGGRNISKYLHYANEQMGRTVFGKFYCRLGDYSMINEHRPEPVDYKNLWLGLRQFQLPEAYATYTQIDGEKCAFTSGKQNTIAFDVDDRQQYSGMYGVTISVEYWDDEPGTFAVGCQNSWTNEWNVVGKIAKTGDGQWKTVSYYKTDWCRSPRNSGKDTHIDLVVHHLDDGRTAVRNVELNFVPARDWARTVVADDRPGHRYAVIETNLSRPITVSPEVPLCGVEVPVWCGGIERNGLRGRVYAVLEDGEEMLTEKEYYLPANGDWFELPFAPVNGCEQYRIELFDANGEVGWYKNSAGDLAVRVLAYDVTGVSADDRTEAPDHDGVSFSSAVPFAGLDLAGVPENASIALAKKLPGSGWSEPVAATPSLGASGRFLFEAQTSGDYLLTVEERDETDFDVTLLALQRRLPPRESVLRDMGETLQTWDLASDASEWMVVKGLERDGNMARLTDRNPALESPPDLGITASVHDWLGFELRNRTNASMARLWWAGEDEAFSAERAVFVPIVPNDDQMRRYWYPVGLEDAWQGCVQKLRFEPVCGITTRGMVKLGMFSFLQSK